MPISGPEPLRIFNLMTPAWIRNNSNSRISYRGYYDWIVPFQMEKHRYCYAFFLPPCYQFIDHFLLFMNKTSVEKFSPLALMQSAYSSLLLNILLKRVLFSSRRAYSNPLFIK